MNGASDDLATLISDVRHDANNSLMAIFGYIELLIGRDDLPESVTTKLKNILTEAHKLRDCIARTAHVRRPN